MRETVRWLLHKLGLVKTKALDFKRTETEFSAEVVRVAEVLAHPNADRLDLVRFIMMGSDVPTGYVVACQRGQFKPGDLAMYFSVDCILPTSQPEFAFLKKEGKATHRLKAARFRGVFSQGLLVPARNDRFGFPAQQFGQQVAEEMGVTYHRPPEPGQPTVATSKPKPQPCPVYGVDSLKKLPNLFADLEPAQLFVTEKIHGTNFRFGWVRRKILGIPVGWRFIVGSHRVIKTGNDGAHFYGEDVWSEFTARNCLADRTKGHRGHVFYAELYGYTYGGSKIQDLTYGLHPEAGPSMAVFDVLSPMGWVEPADRMAICQSLGFAHVPILYYIGGNPADISGGPSLIAPHQIREGVVVETIGVHPRRKAKYVSEAYLMRDEGKHAPNPKKYSVSADAPVK